MNRWLQHARTVVVAGGPRSILSREEGASAIEYGILIAAIAAVIVALAVAIGLSVETLFQDTKDALTEGGF